MKTYQQWQQDKENIKAATDELVGLIDWVVHHPEMATQLAVEIHEIAHRYTEDPTPDVEFHAIIPLAVWRQFVSACIAENAANLNEEACFQIAEYLLSKAMLVFIDQHKHE